jgi:hypothetical protein
MKAQHPMSSGLISGPAARERHKAKRNCVLSLTHKCHVITTRVVEQLIPATPSNASRLLADLVRRGLMQQVNVKYSDLAPRGRAFMLSPEGVRLVVQDECTKVHHYDCRPESLRHDQMNHDLVLAEFAANWIRHGGELLQTDYMARQKNPRGKVPDLLLRYRETVIAAEYERLEKKPRDLDMKIHSSSETHRWPTLWISDVEGNLTHIREALTKKVVPIWSLGSGNKWGSRDEAHLSFNFRARQLLQRQAPWVFERTPGQWIDDFNRLAQTESDRLIKALMREGWSWGQTSLMDWRGEVLCQFPLEIDGPAASKGYFVTYMEGGKWRVCDDSQTPDQGCGMKESFPWKSKDNAPPPLAVIEMAIHYIKAYSYRLPN